MTTAVQKADAETRKIMAAILAHGGGAADFLAHATGIDKTVLVRRLRTCGPNAIRPEFQFFRCAGGKWFLTSAGVERAKDPKSVNGD